MDKKLYNAVNKLELSKLILSGDALNIYFTYKKIKKGCYITIEPTKSYKLENILIKYKLKYKKYDNLNEDTDYFISNVIDPQNIEFFDKNNKQNDIKFGKFLGYGCVHDLDKDKPCTKGYNLQIVYDDYKNPNNNLQIYAFCCLKLTINVINKTLKKINKMNYYIRKYLSDKLKGYIQLSIVKFKNMR
jgi:hypothetical protein